MTVRGACLFLCRLVAELPSTGGVIPSYQLNTVKLIRYVTGGDYFVMACEIFIVIFLVYYTIEEVLEVCMCGKAWMLKPYYVITICRSYQVT
jgi:Polycystin cation channel